MTTDRFPVKPCWLVHNDCQTFLTDDPVIVAAEIRTHHGLTRVVALHDRRTDPRHPTLYDRWEGK